MSEFVNEFMNEIIAVIVFFPPVAAVLLIVAVTKAARPDEDAGIRVPRTRGDEP
jgi:predicted small integral membrane protein